ncbi:helix-turn-helix transcriptional regulator [Bacillus sp. GMs2/2]|uniref:helix-turn-helix transcriptional regulator n=1 Tax=Bacillus sp. GMs2/2 TaxID=3418494 RepID=UPI003CF647BB
MNMKNQIKILKQNQMADALEMSRQTIIAIENHHYNPSSELSLNMAKHSKNIE